MKNVLKYILQSGKILLAIFELLSTIGFLVESQNQLIHWTLLYPPGWRDHPLNFDRRISSHLEWDPIKISSLEASHQQWAYHMAKGFVVGH